jgi:hypothetical protein
MADEVTFSSLSDSRTAEVLSGMWLQLRADRSALPAHPAILLGYEKLVKGSPSNVVSISALGLNGYNKMSPYATEVSAPSNTVITDSKYQATVVRQALKREVGWLARYTDAQGVLNLQGMAADGFGAYQMRLAELVAGLMGGFSSVVGTSGNDLTVAQFLAAKITLQIANANATRPLCILHSRQVGDLQLELATASGGTLQWSEQAARLVDSMSSGLIGAFAGVDVVQSNQVATANGGADRAGGMFVGGAIVWSDSDPDIEDPNVQFPVGNVMVERQRDAANGTTIWVSSAGLGVAEGDDGCGVSIITDA